MHNESKKRKQLPIILGIGVLLAIAICITIGYLFQAKNPDKIFESAITELSQKLQNYIDENIPNELNFQKNDISMSGNIKVDTDYNLGGLEALTDYIYKFQLDASVNKNIYKISMSLEEDSKDILSGKIIMQNKKGYVNVPGILPYPIKIGELDTEITELNKLNITKEDYKLSLIHI